MLSEDPVFGTSMECFSQNIIVANKTRNNSPIFSDRGYCACFKGKSKFYTSKRHVIFFPFMCYFDTCVSMITASHDLC